MKLTNIRIFRCKENETNHKKKKKGEKEHDDDDAFGAADRFAAPDGICRLGLWR